MRIVHFSDIHIGRRTKQAGALFDKRLLGLINYKLNRRHHIREILVSNAVGRITDLDPDLVVCTGDITCIGSPEEFRAACRILEPLVVAPDFKFVYLPGNHDAYVRDRLCRERLRQAFGFLNRQNFSLDSLPAAFDTSEASLLILNEALPTPVWSSAGRLDSTDEQKFADWLSRSDSSKPRILLGHYPTVRGDGTQLPWRRRLKNGEVIRQALQKGELDLALCGHIHDRFAFKHASGAMEICAGSLTTDGFLNVVDTRNNQKQKIDQKWIDVRNCPEANNAELQN